MIMSIDLDVKLTKEIRIDKLKTGIQNELKD